MKRRILSSNIQKEKLKLDESTERMKQFFKREIKRYTKRKDSMKLKQQKQETTDNASVYQDIIRKLLDCNKSLAKKCKSNFILTESVHLWLNISSQK
jgi:hypothetical protein